MLEASAKNALGKSLLELIPDAAGMRQHFDQVLSQGGSVTAREVSLTPAGAKPLSADYTVTLLTGLQDDQELLVELTAVDRLLQLAREARLLELQLANQALTRGLAHEIKNPLGGLRGAAQLLDGQLNDRELREYTRIIIHEADRLSDLVDRMMAPHRKAETGPVNIHRVLEHVLKLIRAQTHDAVTFVKDYDPSLPQLLGRWDQLVQAVLNIVSNSVQALEGRGEITLRTRIERLVTIDKQQHRQVIRTDIEDNGPGIPEALRNHIFFPMVTGRADGTGLGLSIAQDIIRQHGGLIECISAAAKTRFSVYLPLES